MENSKVNPTSSLSTAIIFIHGILGDTAYFDFLKPHCGEHYIEDILLQGHGSMPQDFGRASMAAWRAQVRDTVGRLRNSHSRIIIVAHSMGTLFALQEAAAATIDAALILNSPLRLWPKPRMFATSAKVFFDRIGADPVAAAAKRAYGISPDRNLLHYLRWPARYLELFAEIRRTRKIVKHVKVPITALFAERDEMVSPRSVAVMRQIPTARITTLPQSTHYYYTPADTATIIAHFRAML